MNYCIELVSQGRKEDLERLQSTQSKAARWVLQTRKRDWSLRGGLKKLGWLSMAQQAAYVSLVTAMKVLQKCEPERLHDLLTEVKNEASVRREVDEKKFVKLKATTRKAWSYRSLRWLEQMPDAFRRKDVKVKATKTELKQWIKHHVPVRGDRILWGRPLTGDMRRRKRGNRDEEADSGGTELENLSDVPRQEEQHAVERQQDEGGVQLEEQQRRMESSQGPRRNKVKGVKLGLWMLLLMLSGAYEARAQIDNYEVNISTEKEDICSLSEVWKVNMMKKTTSSQRCGGHRGSVGRVKSGEG